MERVGCACAGWAVQMESKGELDDVRAKLDTEKKKAMTDKVVRCRRAPRARSPVLSAPCGVRSSVPYLH
jgi:hypothetical protein